MSKKLEIVRGTTFPVRITLHDGNKNEYVMPADAALLFGVRRVLSTEAVLVKKATAADEGGYLFDIRPEDTADLTPGDYKYTVNMQVGEDFYPVIRLSDLAITDGITEKGDGA